MTKQTTRIPIVSIILDEDIYPRKRIDPRRVATFSENLRDGFKFDPMEVVATLPNQPNADLKMGSALDIGHLIPSYFIQIASLAVTFRSALMSIINN